MTTYAELIERMFGEANSHVSCILQEDHTALKAECTTPDVVHDGIIGYQIVCPIGYSF